jgi:RNA polymerase sigma-70 factor (ECF subfamily)
MPLVAHDSVDPPQLAAVRWLEDHGDALYAYALARVRRQSVAEDLVQETLLAALASPSAFRGESAERTWLIGILKHKLADHLRRSLRERPISEADAAAVDATLFDRRGRWIVSPSKWSASPHELAESAEFRHVLARCLSHLPTRMAHLFWLREAEDTDTTLLCEQFDVTPANVWAILHRARASLRRCLTIHWFDGNDRL